MGSYSENCPPSVVVTASLSNSSTPPQIRSLEKTLEEAVSLGALRLSGRKLKEISSKLLQKYDLSDTIVADLSKNRLSELPAFVCEFYLLSELSLYSNLLRCLPSDGSLLTLQNLTYLNLSKNQVSVIPQALCELPKLQVLIVSHNRLCSLPEELGHMASLSDLDVSCNEISFLPSQIGDLVSLKYLDLRRNLLVELPPDICELQGLRRLDISENRIQTLPSQMKHMALTEFFCDHNPLVTPPAALCTRGLIHVKKFLDNEDRKRGGSAQSDSGTLTNGRSALRQRESLRLTNLGCYGNVGKSKIDSNLVDGVPSFGFNDKGNYPISSFKDDMNSTDEIRRFAAQRMEFTRSPKKPPLQDQSHITSPSSEANTLQGGMGTPSTLSPTTEFAPPNDPTKPIGFDAAGGHVTPEEEFRQRHEAIVMKQRAEALKRAQKEAVMAFVKQRTNSVTLPPHPQQPPPPPPSVATALPSTISPTTESAPPLPNFTIRRGLDRAREEQELLHRMRQIIESRLKMALPENLAGALTDGVVLCHLANNVRPRSVATIHVPSPATPKLTMAKCRRNVENFLDACRRLGVPSEEVCECGDVLAEFDAQAVLATIEGLLKIAKAKPKCRPPPPPPARDGQQAQIVNNNISKLQVKDESEQPQASDIADSGALFNVEAISRNDSPVSTSEDISNLENLEYDPSDIRLSSMSANQHRGEPGTAYDQKAGNEKSNVTATFQSVNSRQEHDGTVSRLRNMFETAAPKIPAKDPNASHCAPESCNSQTIEGADSTQSTAAVSKPKIVAVATAGGAMLYMYFYHPWILLSLFIGLIIALGRVITQRGTT